jgi:hypothetical protein
MCLFKILCINSIANNIQQLPIKDHAIYLCSKKIGKVWSPLDVVQDKGKHLSDAGKYGVHNNTSVRRLEA